MARRLFSIETLWPQYLEETTGVKEVEFSECAEKLLNNLQNFKLGPKTICIRQVFPLLGKLPPQGMEILWGKEVPQLDENAMPAKPKGRVSRRSSKVKNNYETPNSKSKLSMIMQTASKPTGELPLIPNSPFSKEQCQTVNALKNKKKSSVFGLKELTFYSTRPLSNMGSERASSKGSLYRNGSSSSSKYLYKRQEKRSYLKEQI